MLTRDCGAAAAVHNILIIIHAASVY